MITVVCYNRKETWSCRENALKFYQTGLYSCDVRSSECSRYYNIAVQLKNGWNYCCDDWVSTEEEAKAVCDSCTEMNPHSEEWRMKKC